MKVFVNLYLISLFKICGYCHNYKRIVLCWYEIDGSFELFEDKFGNPILGRLKMFMLKFYSR